jgi:hypothetical protein
MTLTSAYHQLLLSDSFGEQNISLHMALRGSCRELVLINADRQLAVSQALDLAQSRK